MRRWLTRLAHCWLEKPLLNRAWVRLLSGKQLRWWCTTLNLTHNLACFRFILGLNEDSLEPILRHIDIGTKGMGYKGPTIRRQLSRLKSAFERARDLDLLTANHIPSFRLPKDSKPNEGFLELKDFQTFLKAMPEHLRLTVLYLYFTGTRMGELQQITWNMVSRDCGEIIIPGRITKTDDGRTVPLVGPLDEIRQALYEARKKFPKPTDPVFNLTNFRRMWNRTCHKLGLGVYDESTDNRKYSGLHPHDFRRSAARNLIKAGVPRSTAMLITGHKTEAIFERYNIKDITDAEEALTKVGQYTKRVAAISEAR
jgi:integrase